MKKILSLLSVLTISGTAVPTTIAASPYQKEEKLNSDINYQQTNNLKRLKRENNNKLENWYCFLCHNRLVAKISNENWEKIYLNCKDRDIISDRYTYIYTIINDFEKRNSSGDLLDRNDFLDSDTKIIARVIAEHLFEINDLFNKKSEKNSGLYIKTNRDKYWEKYSSSGNNFNWGVSVNSDEKILDRMNKKNGENTLIVSTTIIIAA